MECTIEVKMILIKMIKVILIKNINGKKYSNENNNAKVMSNKRKKRNNHNAFYNKSKKKKHMSNQLCEPMRSHNTFSMEQMKFQQYL